MKRGVCPFSKQRRCLSVGLFVCTVAGRGLVRLSASLRLPLPTSRCDVTYGHHHAGRRAPRLAVSSPAEATRQHRGQRRREKRNRGIERDRKDAVQQCGSAFSAEGARMSTKPHVRPRQSCVRGRYHRTALGNGRCSREAQVQNTASRRRSFGAHEARREGGRFSQTAAVRPRNGVAHQQRFHSPHPFAFAGRNASRGLN